MPEKKEFYSNISIDGIADADYMEAKRVGKDFERKNLGEYHNLYLKDDILLLAVFENFREMYLSFRSCKNSFSSWIRMVSRKD